MPELKIAAVLLRLAAPATGRSCSRALWTLLINAATASAAHAHSAPLDRRVDWSDWNLDPAILLSLTLIAWLYVKGWERRFRSGGSPYGIRWQPLAFVAGIATLAAALVSPLDLLSDQLGAAHMVQHMILATVAAPLVIMGSPLWTCFWGLPRATRRSLGRLRNRRGLRQASDLLANAGAAWVLYAVVLWVWHLPNLYLAALRNPFIHDIQHVSFFAAGCVFWRVLLEPTTSGRLHGAVAVIYLFTTTMHATFLGVLMTLAPAPWYPLYEGRTSLWNLTVLEDQQLAGLIMWMPACASYLVAAVALLIKSLEEEKVDAPQATTHSTPPALVALQSSALFTVPLPQRGAR